MTAEKYELLGNNFNDTANVPKGQNIFYRCTDCETMIPSVPDDNIGCTCGNVFIDKDYGRLVVANMKRFEAIRRVR